MTIGTGLRQKQKKKRGLAVVFGFLLLAGIVVAWQVFGIREVGLKFKEYFSSVTSQQQSEDHIRGTLYDRNYKELAVSLPRVSVFARSRELQSMEAAAESLAPVLETDAATLLQKLQGNELRIWLAKGISQQQEDAVKALKIPGVYLHKEHSRYYPQKNVAAHLIGFVQDDIGLAGAEYNYDRLVQKMLTQSAGSEYRGGAGQHVLLTIDLKVQAILEKLVEDLTVGRQNVRIGAYAMDAGSGALVASVQFPSFDPNRYRIYPQGQLESLLIKPMLLPPVFRMIFRDSAAIQSQYESRGQVHPWSISAAQLSLGGELRLWENLGLNAGAPADFGNNENQLARASEVYVVSGQELYDYGTVPESLSPLNLMCGLSALLNGGKKVEPYIAQAVVDEISDDEYQLKPLDGEVIATSIIDEAASREISRMISTLGKTDKIGGVTIQGVVQANIGSVDGFESFRNELYFAAVPIEKAELSLLLTIQGGSRQVPVKEGVKMTDPGRALADVLPRIAVLQEVGKSIAGVAEPTSGVSGNYPVHLDKVREAVRSSRQQDSAELADPGKMPELVGLSLRKSLRLLQNSHCKIRIFGTGRVVSQEPKAGSSLVGVKECVIKMQKQEDVTLEALEEKTSEKK